MSEERAMYRFFRHIQDQIDEFPIHEDIDEVPVNVCLSEFSLFRDALGDKGDSTRWHDLGEKYTSYLGTWPQSEQNSD